MSQELNEAELREERLVQVAMEGDALDLMALPLRDMHIVLEARLHLANLMLKLAMRLDRRA